jgi:hypothetical protein
VHKEWNKDIAYGLHNGYPICCIIAYCLGLASGVVIRNNDLSDVYRPCPIHRRSIGVSDVEWLKRANDGVCPLPRNDFDSKGDYKRELVYR